MVAKSVSGMKFPTIGSDSFVPTRDAVHDYARVLGDVLKACRPKRKHWWHASLRPSLRGLSTGVIRGGRDFELELDLYSGQCRARSVDGESLDVDLNGQSATVLAESLSGFLGNCGVDTDRVTALIETERAVPANGYSNSETGNMGQVLTAVASALEQFRATIPEETSPVQLWPHHFDLSMIWLPGEKIAGQDPGNEEYSDKQMNFGFGFGDAAVQEPYFYVTAYPTPEGISDVQLPGDAEWKTDGFSGVVVTYADVTVRSNPTDYLLELWTILLNAGREKMLESN